MRIVLLATLMFLAGLVEAAQMPIAALPGGTLVYKPVQSLRERRFADLVQQKTDFSCGAAALATVLKQAYWLDVDEHQVIEGMRARGYRVEPDTLEKVSIPVIVLMDIRGYKHFVVLQRIDTGWAYIGDPVLGHKRYKFDDFLKGWNGIIFAVIGPGYDKANALLDPPAPLTAKNRVNGFYPVEDAQLMEFGFIQSDFF